jgi:nitrite reductase/ring-hydroxylating ferredoxin subunit
MSLHHPRLAGLCNGQSIGLDPHGTGRDTVFVIRHAGRLFAYENRCPHYGDTPMAWRKDAYLDGSGTRIVCAAHGAQFDIETGACLLGPCLGQALTPVPLAPEDDDRVPPSTLSLAVALQAFIPS